ncbi:ChrR family anti-sigma-E factor [Marinobacter sp.]|uniref:ChrR family anti-sigma-E factor n=1 Tax=Marinobacter sp. TaxID=50741 RepID=UPI00384F7010
MTSHHPESLTLMEFSAGNLSDPHALCIRLHLDQCPHCRSRVDMLESLGAVMMEQQDQVSVSESAFDSILARIESEPRQENRTHSAQRPMGPLQKLLGDDLNSLPWKRQLGDVSILDISDRFPDQSEQVVLQKLTAGGKAPAHTHRGQETTIVLQGAFADNKGVFHQWDFVVLNEKDEHKPVALEGDDCITLSVLSAPLKLTGMFTRMLNPFIR